MSEKPMVPDDVEKRMRSLAIDTLRDVQDSNRKFGERLPVVDCALRDAYEMGYNVGRSAAAKS